ncbi:putative transporter [Aspergillus oryzae 100-8]|uniref:Putative transporter n=1 Tax=Aspergillus oryzae (strain 3.042) TaxID=1160506 RepID=I7ZY88_ASPO3|nr:putative transporter [Aspergillus oryzae 3.042]KDE82289.1 putative transporter [Aspergillus oryzae 100-8]|eukprot:EIT77259.1 putative transporter [Aspergillus oryzae 3.042]
MTFLQRIIRNDTVKSDPPEIYNFRVVLISLSACGASMLFGFDMGVIGGVLTMNSFKEQYGLKGKEDTVLANLESNIVSVIQAGSFLGALVSTYVANAIGRRLSLILSALILFVGVAMQAGASGIIGVLYAGRQVIRSLQSLSLANVVYRFIGGVSIGIASSVCPIYIAENAPRGIRGLLTGFYQLTLVFGLTVLQLAFWINYGCERHLTGKEQFIIPLSLQAFPAVILLVGMLFANESPRYLAMKRPERAPRVLATLRGLPEDHPYVIEELNNLRRQLEEESQHSESSMWCLLKESFSKKSYRRRSILCITLMIPTIFASVGLSSSSVGLFATGIYGIVKFIACGIFIVFVSDTLGRRRSLLWTGIVQGIMLFYVGFYVRFDTISENAPITPQGYIALIAIYLFAAVYQFRWGPVVWSYCAEIPPARLRALNMGMATASQWFFNFVVAKSTPTMFATLGKNGYGTYFVYRSFCFVMVIYTWYFVPETKGLSLEFMDELFERDTVRGKFMPARDVHYLADRQIRSPVGRCDEEKLGAEGLW